jgi:iron complex outermembrane receptor protein
LSTSKSAPTWRANLSWHVTSGVMAYASYSTGYKSGGFNSAGASPALTPTTRTFADETSDNYELGVKSVLFNKRLLINADIYQMDIDNFQQRSFNGQVFIIKNAGDIRSRGVEVDSQYQISDHFKAQFGGDYLYSYYTSNPTASGLPGCSAAVLNSCVGYETIVGGNPAVQNLTGRPNSLSPKWQGDVALEYDSSPFAGGWVMQIRPDVSYLDKFYSTPDDNTQGIIKSHTLLDLRVNLLSPDGRWTFTLYGTNLTNQHYWTLKYSQPLAGAFGGNNAVTGQSILRGFMGQPLFIGGKISAHF